jgi:diguanylate cyclase (GGDEF)-like protein/PAS domain S-box-containing protein
MNEQFYRELIDNLYDGVYTTDCTKNITYWNKAAERITGYTKDEVIGSKCSDNILRHIDEKGTELCFFGCPLAATITDGKIREADVFLHHKDGHRVPISVRVIPLRDNAGKIIGGAEVFSENYRKTKTLKELEFLKNEVFLDPVTKIGNRKLAQRELQQRFQDMQSHKIPFGLLFVDIDNFKKFNDNYGHEIGDRVLRMVAQTMSHTLRGRDLVTRWGGEEFLVILSNISLPSLKAIAERIRVLIEKSWLRVNERNLQVTVSIGGTLVKEQDSIESLVKRADQQMYISKKSGKNRVTFAEDE